MKTLTLLIIGAILGCLAIMPPSPPDSTADMWTAEALLRHYAPTRYPVTLSVENIDEEETLSYTEWNDAAGTFAIVLDRSLRGVAVTDALIHEWAHVLSWDDDPCHGRVWGRSYAFAYRAVWEDEDDDGCD